jgi:hypothetical protein
MAVSIVMAAPAGRTGRRTRSVRRLAGIALICESTRTVSGKSIHAPEDLRTTCENYGETDCDDRRGE